MSTGSKPPRAAWAGFALFVLTPAAAIAGGLAMAPLATLFGALAAPLKTLPAAIRRTWPLWALAAAVALYALVSLSWSASPAWALWLKLVALALCGAALIAGTGATARARAILRAAGLAALLALALLLVIEAASGLFFNRLAQPDTPHGLLERNPMRGAAILVLLAAAAAGGLGRARWRDGAIFAGLAATLWTSLQFSMDANIVAFTLAALVFALTWAAPRLGLRIVFGAAALWVIAAPWLLQSIVSRPDLLEALPLSWAMRLEVWDYSIARTLERPLLGWGFDASRTFTDSGAVRGLVFPLLPLHPHNASLQIWLELGAVGAGLVAAFLALAGWRIADAFANQRGPAAALAAVAAVALTIWSISYGTWQEWWIGAVCAAFALAQAQRA